jgi:hypothetical protein
MQAGQSSAPGGGSVKKENEELSEVAKLRREVQNLERLLRETQETIKVVVEQRDQAPRMLQEALAQLAHQQRSDTIRLVDEATGRFRLGVAAAERTNDGDDAILRQLASTHDLDAPMEKLIKYRAENRPNSHPRYWAVANFDLHSRHPRLFIFDVIAERTEAYLCAHGKGSEGATDDGMADVFSNIDGSGCSSLGIYLCAETYYGDNGYSMRLDGLQSSNSRARHRAIVVHGAPYVSQHMITESGRIGRSLGCPAVEHQHKVEVIDALRNGSLLMVWKSGEN